MSIEKPTDGDLVCGDVHGCYDTLMNLLRLANINLDTNRVWFVGDLIHKGPKQREVLDWKKRYGATSTTANHEDKEYRGAKGNKVQVTSEMRDYAHQLGDEAIERALEFATWPLYIPFEDAQGPGHIVHAGVGSEEHFNTMEKQPKNYLIRMRTDPFTMYVKGQPLAAPPWQDKYNGRFGTILHGHQPSESAQWHDNPHVYSLDGGCVYGNTRGWTGCIRGIILGSREVFEAPFQQHETDHYFSLDDVED